MTRSDAVLALEENAVSDDTERCVWWVAIWLPTFVQMTIFWSLTLKTCRSCTMYISAEGEPENIYNVRAAQMCNSLHHNWGRKTCTEMLHSVACWDHRIAPWVRTNRGCLFPFIFQSSTPWLPCSSSLGREWRVYPCFWSTIKKHVLK